MTDDTSRPEPTSATRGPDPEPTRSWDADPTIALPGPASAPATSATTVLPNPTIAPYLDAVRLHLADLPADERTELLEDLDAHLHEIVAEEGDAFGARMGSPAEYAAEFRASAGYPPLGSAGSPRLPIVLRIVGPAREWWQRLDGWLRVSPAGPTVVAVLHRLRPVWWVFRGWVVAYLLAGDSVLHSLGFGRTGTFLALVVCIGLSLAWGMRAERRTRRLPIVEQGLLLLVNAWIIVLCLDGITGGSPLGYIGASSDSVESADPALSSGLSMGGEPITNLTAYDLDGKPIPGFQLFDQDGNRVVADTSAQYGPNAELVYPLPATDSHGYPVNGVFPVTYVLATEYYDENAETSALQVSRVLTVGEGAALSGLTAAVPPPVGSIVPIDQNGNPQWAEAVVPEAPATGPSAGASPSPTPTPSPSPTKSAKAAKAK